MSLARVRDEVGEGRCHQIRAVVEPAAKDSRFVRVRLSYVVDGPWITPHGDFPT